MYLYCHFNTTCPYNSKLCEVSAFPKLLKNSLIHSNATTGCTALTNTKWIQGEKKNYVQSLSRNQFIPIQPRLHI